MNSSDILISLLESILVLLHPFYPLAHVLVHPFHEQITHAVIKQKKNGEHVLEFEYGESSIQRHKLTNRQTDKQTMNRYYPPQQ